MKRHSENFLATGTTASLYARMIQTITVYIASHDAWHYLKGFLCPIPMVNLLYAVSSCLLSSGHP